MLVSHLMTPILGCRPLEVIGSMVGITPEKFHDFVMVFQGTMTQKEAGLSSNHHFSGDIFAFWGVTLINIISLFLSGFFHPRDPITRWSDQFRKAGTSQRFTVGFPKDGMRNSFHLIPIGSMYAIFTYICQKNQPFMWVNISVSWILSGKME